MIESETGQPEFLGMDLSPFSNDNWMIQRKLVQKSQQEEDEEDISAARMPEALKQCFVSLFVKIDK